MNWAVILAGCLILGLTDSTNRRVEALLLDSHILLWYVTTTCNIFNKTIYYHINAIFDLLKQIIIAIQKSNIFYSSIFGTQGEKAQEKLQYVNWIKDKCVNNLLCTYLLFHLFSKVT